MHPLILSAHMDYTPSMRHQGVLSRVVHVQNTSLARRFVLVVCSSIRQVQSNSRVEIRAHFRRDLFCRLTCSKVPDVDSRDSKFLLGRERRKSVLWHALYLHPVALLQCRHQYSVLESHLIRQNSAWHSVRGISPLVRESHVCASLQLRFVLRWTSPWYAQVHPEKLRFP